MENGAYVSPPQLPPQAHLSAAAAFQAAAANSAAAAGGAVTPFQEALMSRMGRPFGLSVSKHFYRVFPCIKLIQGKGKNDCENKRLFVFSEL